MATTAQTLSNFIDGEPVASEAETEPVLNPATGEELARAPRSTPEDVDRAVRAARRAFDGWSRTPPGRPPRAGGGGRARATQRGGAARGGAPPRAEPPNAEKPIEAVKSDEIPVML